jgi:hypothetical protein
MTAQKTEFLSTLSGVEGCKKYTPKTATVNGKKGRIWTRRQLIDGAWVHQGQVFVRAAAPEHEVAALVDMNLDA